MGMFIQIDEEGYFISNGLRVTDPEYGHALLKNLYIENRIYKTKHNNSEIFVEAFDQPYIALGVSTQTAANHVLEIELPYNFKVPFNAETLCTDSWDRFHGRTTTGVPFVFSRAAQMQFFDLLDSYDDDSFVLAGKKYATQTVEQFESLDIGTRPNINTEDFWGEPYRQWISSETAPGWELAAPAKPLVEVLPQIKIPRSRVCVLGCGTGNDAAYLASQGHIVMGVDLSQNAIERARKTHGESAKLKFICADAFQFAKENTAQFDLVFEHTFYCAIDPTRRAELVSAWRNLLAEDGHFLGIFYLLDRTSGPPFGTTEWEIRERMKKKFEFLYWTRWKSSIPRRMGAEHVVYAALK